MNDLFRKEVTEAQRPHMLGTIRLATPVSHQAWAWAAAAFTVAIASWLYFGHYTQRKRVTGTLVPQAGLLDITAATAGTVSQLDIVQGKRVRKGTALLTLSTPHDSGTMGDTTAAIRTQLLRQHEALTSDLANAKHLATQQATDLHMQQHMLQRQIGQITAQLTIEKEQAARLSRLFRQIHPMLAKGYVSVLQVQQQRDELSSTQATVKALERQRTQNRQQLASIGDQLAELPPNTSTKLNELRQQLAQNRQAQVTNAANATDVLQAPAKGTVASVLVHAGQAVEPGQTLATILPQGSVLQARLLVPSSAIGFVHEGTRVVVHYQAFPYQKFGVQHGTVTRVSRNALTPAEITALIGRSPPPEPMYRVSVKLDAQSIDAYGKPHALLPGMALTADLLLDRRRMIEWIFEPLYGMAKRGGSHA